MRNPLLIASIFLLGLNACGQKAEKTVEEVKVIPVVDVNAVYPQKEIPVQELGKVRYIQLETSDKALLSDEMSLTISDGFFFFYHYSRGDVAGFDPDGKLITSFNRKGQGINEYSSIQKVVYDKENKQIFLSAQGVPTIYVFGLDGTGLNQYPTPDTLKIWDFVSFDKQTLLAWDMKHAKPVKDGKPAEKWADLPTPDPAPFVLINKADGQLLSRLPLSFPEHFRHFFMTKVGDYSYVYIAQINPLVPCNEGFILNENAADTTYLIKPDQTIQPILARTPPVIQDLNKGKLVNVLAMTGKQLLIRTHSLRMEEAQPGVGLKEGILSVNLSDGNISEYTLRDKEWEGTGGLLPKAIPANNKLFFKLYPHILKEALAKGQLTGELETFAKSLNADDNIVMMEVTLSE